MWWCRPAFNPGDNTPDKWRVTVSNPKNQPAKDKGWGGWNDKRDHNLCKSMLPAAKGTPEEARTQFKWLADLSSGHDNRARRRRWLR